MLAEIHFLLTYNCNFECDHCFLYCGPTAAGTFTINQVDQVLKEALKIGSVNMVYFEGGEPTLYYPLLLESVKRAHQYGLDVGIVSNAYGALTEEDARLWLEPLVEASNQPWLWLELGECYQWNHRFEDARKAYESAITGSRDAGESTILLRSLRRQAVLSEAQQDWVRAETAYSELFALNPGDPEIAARLDKTRSMRHKD